MIKDFWRMLTEPMSNDVLGWVMLVLIWVVFLMIFGLLIWGILYAINFWFMSEHTGVAKVYAMYFEKSHYTTTYIMSGKVMVPVTTYHPDAWKLTLEMNGLTDDFYVTSEQYVKYKLGDSVRVTYTNGRLWESLSIVKAWV